jgi:uncharacterized protein YjeT (DUF2065 family)
VDILLSALGLMLILEGLLPMIAPGRWRAIFLQIARLQDGQIRFVGMGSAVLGVVFLLI